LVALVVADQERIAEFGSMISPARGGPCRGLAQQLLAEHAFEDERELVRIWFCWLRKTSIMR